MNECVADGAIEIAWRSAALYDSTGQVVNDPRHTFTYNPAIHGRDDFWGGRGGGSAADAYTTTAGTPVEPYEQPGTGSGGVGGYRTAGAFSWEH